MTVTDCASNLKAGVAACFCFLPSFMTGSSSSRCCSAGSPASEGGFEGGFEPRVDVGFEATWLAPPLPAKPPLATPPPAAVGVISTSMPTPAPVAGVSRDAAGAEGDACRSEPTALGTALSPRSGGLGGGLDGRTLLIASDCLGLRLIASGGLGGGLDGRTLSATGSVSGGRRT